MAGTYYSILLALVIIHSSLPVLAKNMTLSEKDLANRLLHEDVYDSSIRPSLEKAVAVEVDLVLNSVGPVNDIDMEIGASFYLRQQWVDPRLQFSDFNHSIILSEKKLTSLWVPDLFYPQSTEEKRHVITTPNVLIRVHPDGTILFSQRLSVTVGCKMDLGKFPLDSQVCYIKMESYSYTTDDVFFKWSTQRNATSVLPNAYIPDFTLTGISTSDCTAVYETGSFTCIQAELNLRREIGFYATQTYIPSILIVVLSWASFWIDHEAVPARISVGLLTVLTITTQSSGARAQLPRVPYVKGIDIWMSSCLVFVFAAYMEYAVVTVLSRRYKKRKEKEEKERASTVSKGTSTTSLSAIALSDSQDGELRQTFKSKKDTNTGSFVDKLSRFLFPLAFVIFNLVYWIYYIHVA